MHLAFVPVTPALEIPGLGVLSMAQLTVEPRTLEQSLEALAQMPFPVNPEIRHLSDGKALIEFPVYANHYDKIVTTLQAVGLIYSRTAFQTPSWPPATSFQPGFSSSFQPEPER
jgi:hypothetical protein